MAITQVSLISVWVKDLEESLAFYTDVLGFELGADVRLSEDFRWLTVSTRRSRGCPCTSPPPVPRCPRSS
jgi:catechol 2,3-dioxygenase-like lactoylglutathione lyase family enzyme